MPDGILRASGIALTKLLQMHFNLQLSASKVEEHRGQWVRIGEERLVTAWHHYGGDTEHRWELIGGRWEDEVVLAEQIVEVNAVIARACGPRDGFQEVGGGGWNQEVPDKLLKVR